MTKIGSRRYKRFEESISLLEDLTNKWHPELLDKTVYVNWSPVDKDIKETINSFDRDKFDLKPF